MVITAVTPQTTISPNFPGTISAGDLLVMLVGQKPTVANGGTVTTPAGWTLVGSLTGAGGYGATLGADTGNTNIFAYSKVATGSETGTETVTLSQNDAAWAQITAYANATGNWSVAAATGSDTSAGNVSIAFGTDPGVAAGDFIHAGFVIPTDVTTPSQFSAEAFSQTGVVFGAVTEISEADSGTGNDMGGFIVSAPVSSGASSSVPTMTATAGGTTTNVRGPGIFIRLREVAGAAVASLLSPMLSQPMQALLSM